MKITLLLCLLVVALAAAATFVFRNRLQSKPDEGNLEAAIDREVAKARKGGRFPGLVIGVLTDERVFIKGYGQAQTKEGGAPNAQTFFQIGSLSKLFTASLLRSLCEEGLVSLDSTLEELIGQQKPLAAKVKGVTLRQLVTHTSGFPSIPKSIHRAATDAAGEKQLEKDPYRYLTPETVFAYLATAEDKKAAGSFEYSNFGMGLLGHVLELVGKEKYEVLVEQRVLRPKGMHRTTTTLSQEDRALLAAGHAPNGDPAEVWTFHALAGAGAFYSTAEDMAKFLQASLGEMETTAREDSPAAGKPSRTDPTLGWMKPTLLDRFFGNESVVWHNGMVGGYASYLSIDVKSRTGVFVLANQATATEMVGMMLTRAARTRSWAK